MGLRGKPVACGSVGEGVSDVGGEGVSDVGGEGGSARCGRRGRECSMWEEREEVHDVGGEGGSARQFASGANSLGRFR